MQLTIEPMPMRVLPTFVAILFLASCNCPAQAQQRGIPIGSAGGARHVARARRTGRYYAGYGYSPGYYSGYDDSGYAEMPSPPLLQMPPPAPPAESLVLELEGDHWVRIGNGGETQSAVAPAAAAAQPAAAIRTMPSSAPAAPLPPALLVFRDGHQEEIARYTISGRNIVTPADYWATGSWTRKIPIADLNVPETLRLNQQRGAQFRLPSGPNEVMVRP
jgi:hypothetical protein